MRYFIHTNYKQLLAAKVSRFNSMENFSSPNVEIINIEDYIDVEKFNNKTYLRNGIETKWDKDDLQSFTLLRFIIPEISNYQGISIVTDPDVFLLKDFNETIFKYKDNDLTVRRVVNQDNPKKNYLESSIMIFNNHKFKFTNIGQILELLFSHELDYKDLIHLEYYKRNGIEIFEADENFNSFDQFNEKTEFLHTTNRITQPWKTGLKVDFYKYKFDYGESSFVTRMLNKIYGNIKNIIFPKKYLPHPNKSVADLFNTLFAEALKSGFISQKEIHENIKKKFISKNYLKFLD